MKKNEEQKLSWYSQKEEKINIYTHGLGIILSAIAFVLLINKATHYSWLQASSLILYGLSQLAIFSASTLYHSQTIAKKRSIYNIIDHAMIYVSIAGTYSPLCLIALKFDGGIMLFTFIWICALLGMLLKIKFTGRFNVLSTLIYLAMGWVIVFYWSEINAQMPIGGIYLIIAGGVAYTIGAILYMIEKIPYNHAIFHVFILIAAICHFSAIYWHL